MLKLLCKVHIKLILHIVLFGETVAADCVKSCICCIAYSLISFPIGLETLTCCQAR